MDTRVGSSLKRRNDDTNNSPSKLPRFEARGILSHSRPNGAEISMRDASVVTTFAAQSVATHSLVSNDFSHQAVDRALRAELEGKWILNVPIDDFIQAAFTDTNEHAFKSPTHKPYEGYIAAVEQYLRDVQPAKDRLQSFAFLVNYVAEARFAHTKMVLLGGRSVKGQVDRKVPACIVCALGASSSSDVSWEDILVPFHFIATRAKPQSAKGSEGVTNRVGKSTGTKGKLHVPTAKSSPAAIRLEPREVLAGYALEILSASGLRQHVIAVLVDNESISLWYFDRSGVISSTEMNLTTETDREMFYDVLGILGCASRTDLGYVRRLCPSAWWPSTENAGSLLLMGRNGKSRNWDLANLKKLNTDSRGLIGRGTTVYSFGDSNAPFALKLSWQPTSRPSEARCFVAAEDAGVEGIPHVLAMGHLASLSDGIRSRLPSSPSPWAGQTDRELRALVLDRVCRPLNEFPIVERPLDFLNIFKQLITIHYDLYNRARILHRDISPNNLMWAPGGSDGVRDVGYLVDFDFAFIEGEVEQTGVDHTLALPFVAIDHLPPDIVVVPQSQLPPAPTAPARHLYRHDLEGFFWSFWWILLNAARDKGDTATIDAVLSRWKQHDLGKNRDDKRGFLHNDTQSRTLITWWLWREHEHRAIMEDFVNEMSEMFSKGYLALDRGGDYLTAGGYITYENLTQVFPLGLRRR